MRAVLSHAELREVFDRVLQGEKIATIAKELNINRSALNDRLKRRFPAEYEDAVSQSKIKSGGAPSTYLARLPRLQSDPAVQAYLNKEGTLKEIAERFQMSHATLHRRVQRVKDLQRQLQSQRLET